METEQFHDLLCASWRPRKASGVIQYEFEGLETKGADGVNLSPRAEEYEMRYLKSGNKARKKWMNSSFLLFYSGLQWIR